MGWGSCTAPLEPGSARLVFRTLSSSVRSVVSTIKRAGSPRFANAAEAAGLLPKVAGMLPWLNCAVEQHSALSILLRRISCAVEGKSSGEPLAAVR